MHKVLVVFGTRPEAIKLAPVVKALRQAGMFEVRVCVTAQHRQMLDQVLALFAITPDVDLDVMQPGQDLTDLTARVLVGMRGVLRGAAGEVVDLVAYFNVTKRHRDRFNFLSWEPPRGPTMAWAHESLRLVGGDARWSWEVRPR